MKVWLLGARGMLGQAAARLLAANKIPTLTTGREVDITRLETLEQVPAAGVTHIINCAAYTKVDDAESEEELAGRVNGLGPTHIGQIAAKLGAAAVHISTDYVFNGQAHSPYLEDHPTGPLNAYGRTKLQGEKGFMAASEGAPEPFYLVRTSWLFGRGRHNFVTTMLRLMGDRKELSVVSDQRGRPTYCDDLARGCLRLLGITGAPAPGGFYHFANSSKTTWHGFAEAILELGRKRGMHLACERINPIPTEDFPTPAERPAYSVLDTTKFSTATHSRPRPWKEALAEYIDHLAAEQGVNA